MKRWVLWMGLGGCGLLGMGCFLGMDDLAPWNPTLPAGQGGVGGGHTAAGQGGVGGEHTAAGEGGNGGGGDPGPVDTIPCGPRFKTPVGSVGEPIATFISHPTTGSCYALIKPPIGWKRDWTTAKEKCQHNNMHLAIIATQEERQFINEKLMNKGDGSEAWIGGRHDPNETWKWWGIGDSKTDWVDINTAPCTQDMSNPSSSLSSTCFWKEENPNNLDDDVTKPYCIMIEDNTTLTGDGWFNDRDCTQLRDFLCEREK